MLFPFPQLSFPQHERYCDLFSLPIILPQGLLLAIQGKAFPTDHPCIERLIQTNLILQVWTLDNRKNCIGINRAIWKKCYNFDLNRKEGNFKWFFPEQKIVILFKISGVEKCATPVKFLKKGAQLFVWLIAHYSLFLSVDISVGTQL